MWPVAQKRKSLQTHTRTTTQMTTVHDHSIPDFHPGDTTKIPIFGGKMFLTLKIWICFKCGDQMSHSMLCIYTCTKRPTLRGKCFKIEKWRLHIGAAHAVYLSLWKLQSSDISNSNNGIFNWNYPLWYLQFPLWLICKHSPISGQVSCSDILGAKNFNKIVHLSWWCNGDITNFVFLHFWQKSKIKKWPPFLEWWKIFKNQTKYPAKVPWR